MLKPTDRHDLPHQLVRIYSSSRLVLRTDSVRRFKEYCLAARRIPSTTTGPGGPDTRPASPPSPHQLIRLQVRFTRLRPHQSDALGEDHSPDVRPRRYGRQRR